MTEYETAVEAARAASAIFRKAQEDYRARRIGDAEYLAARLAFKRSEVAFDEAYAKASS